MKYGDLVRIVDVDFFEGTTGTLVDREYTQGYHRYQVQLKYNLLWFSEDFVRKFESHEE